MPVKVKVTTDILSDRFVHYTRSPLNWVNDLHDGYCWDSVDTSGVVPGVSAGFVDNESVTLVDSIKHIEYQNSKRLRKVVRYIPQRRRRGKWRMRRYTLREWDTFRSPWRFNPCYHVKWRSLLGTTGQIMLRRDASYDFYTACPHAYYHQLYGHQEPLHGFTVHKTGEGYEEIAFSPSMLFADRAIPVGEGEDDPYLPIESSARFKRKLWTLDKMAIDTMVPRLDTGFSLPVFIFEIFELKALFRTVQAALTRFKREFMKKIGKKPLRQLSRRWLETVFGWLPFINDVKTIITKLWNLRKTITEYLRFANRALTLHYQKGLDPLSFQDIDWFTQSYEKDIACTLTKAPGYEEVPFNGIFSCSLDCESQREVSSLSYHATMNFIYLVPLAQKFSQEVVAFYAALETFGVQLSLEDIWEVVPFSFVVDWIVRIGPWIEENVDELHALPSQVVIFDYCRSLKYRLVQREVVTGIRGIYLDGQNCDVGQWDIPVSEFTNQIVDSYYREVGLPVPSDGQLPGFKTPKGLQWISAAALAYQKLAPYKWL